ncbi:MAG: type III-A CRISPR-associated protein Cas10/Csm1 [Coleofasciculaceae cyanobacterium SM2_1_6]|nr:type III-A CRISPR-associated protein Cas10/Csm1 [Coleofasciculaceae cyanobacterium SM2_1_6]
MSNVSLHIMQKAIASLLNPPLQPDSLPFISLSETEEQAIKGAKKILGLPETGTDIKVGLLKLIFDLVHLENKQDSNNGSNKSSSSTHYIPLQKITCESDAYPPIPYPAVTQPSPESLTTYQQGITQEITPYLDQKKWEDCDFVLFILEKYGSCVSYGDDHTALVDAARMTAAIAEALVQNQASLQQTSLEQKIHLVAGSLSGIQNFIYTIASDGALKSLRARSFYLELVAEEIVRRLLAELNLPRTSVIYAGGGNLFLLGGDSEDKLKEKLQTLQDKFNKWLLKEFQGKICFSLDYALCDIKDVGSAKFRDCWDQAIAKLAKQKNQKFINQIGDLLAPKDSHLPCKVCHRDDVDIKNLKPLNKRDLESPLACPTCRDMFELGDDLPNTLIILRTNSITSTTILGASHGLEVNGYYYYLFENVSKLLIRINPETDTIYTINSWKIEDYSQGQVLPMLMGRYYQPEDGRFITAEKLAEVAQGINRVGYLRMDVDRLGQIFAKGLDDHNYSLPRVASLSRQMSYFFKVYLNSLASDRKQNFLEYQEREKFQILSESDRKNLMFIYAGGDDLFISGAWNEIIEFALDIYQSFRAYAGNNPDITISGGISIEGAKFPLYQAANSSGSAEEKAKGNGRDSLGLFGEAFKWEEWLGAEEIDVQHIKALKKSFEYIGTNEKLDIFGVLPITQAILSLLKSEAQASRNFTHNLLATAQVQEQKIAEIANKRKVKQYDTEEEDIRYFLHLPKIAYTLARLPSQVKEYGSFSKIRTSLKSPYNAPYFRAIATWIELLNRVPNNSGE